MDGAVFSQQSEKGEQLRGRPGKPWGRFEEMCGSAAAARERGRGNGQGG